MIICKRPVHPDDHLQKALDDHCCCYCCCCELDESGKLDEYGEPGSKEEKSLLEEEINGDADQPTNRANIEQSAFSKVRK